MGNVMRACAAAVLAAGAALADTAGFQLSLTPEWSLQGRETRIEGLSLNIWGENPQTGLTIGLVNGAAGESAGLTFGLLNYAESYKGAQWAFANFTGRDMTGWQGGPVFGILVSGVNYVGGEMRGLQTGIVNLAGTLTGVQVGLVNYAQYVDVGLQVGLVNVMPHTQGWFESFPEEVAPIMVLVNWKF